MKRVFILIGIILALSVSILNVKESSAAPADPRCLSFKVSFTARNWVGGPIQIGCQGLNAGPCVGGIKTVRPNKTVTLNNCACPFNNKGEPKNWADGCLYVAKELKSIKRSDSKNRPGVDVKTPLPQQCTINTNKFTRISNGFYRTNENYCGQNKQEVEVPIRITCPGSDTPTPTTSCPAPSPVTGVKIKCPECKQSTPSASPTEAQATATPTTTATATPTTAQTGGNE